MSKPHHAYVLVAQGVFAFMDSFLAKDYSNFYFMTVLISILTLDIKAFSLRRVPHWLSQ